MWRIVLHLSPFTTAAAVVLVFCFTVVFRLAEADRPCAVRRVAALLLVAWTAVVLLATLAASDSGTGGGGLWLSPGFDTLITDSPYVTAEEKRMVWRQWTANALMFVPLPVLVTLLWRDLSALTCFLLCAGAGAAVEATQWLQGNGRVVDLDDVAFNAFGGALGIGVNAVAIVTARRLRRTTTAGVSRARGEDGDG
ncbi:VanZ family protein [Streptomyces xinghaiensis]|uniref:VanZ family protein n=1 Tax=Streptomyces xinghaiensis TaxID=1038928 RepID=UPI00343E6FC1